MSRNHRRLDWRQWSIARRAALDAAGWRCSVCGAARRLEVHHRVALEDGGSKYDLDNLEVRCRPCHFGAHSESRLAKLPADVQAWRNRLNSPTE